MNRILPYALLAASFLPACRSQGEEVQPLSKATTEAERAALAPADVVQRLKDGNKRFVTGAVVARDWKALVESSAKGASPIAAVLTTTDGRLALPRAFDLGPGDLVVVRTLCCAPTDDALSALETAVLVDGVKAIAVLLHGDCGGLVDAYSGDDTRLPMVARPLTVEAKRKVGPDMQPLAASVEGFTLEDEVTVAYAKEVLASILERSPELRLAVENGSVMTAVGYYDLGTGAIVWF